jgi:hypothetical protein
LADIYDSDNDGVVDVLPNIIGTVTISGIPTQNQTLTAAVSDDDGRPPTASITYQWKRSSDGVNYSSILGTGTTFNYTLVQADVGQFIKIFVRYTDNKNTSENITSIPTSKIENVNDPGSVTISGILLKGSIFTAIVSDDDGRPPTANITYQWLRSSSLSGIYTNITQKGTSFNYTLIQEDVGQFIRVFVRYIDNQNTPENVMSKLTVAIHEITTIKKYTTNAKGIQGTVIGSIETITSTNSDGSTTAITIRKNAAGIMTGSTETTTFTNKNGPTTTTTTTTTQKNAAGVTTGSTKITTSTSNGTTTSTTIQKDRMGTVIENNTKEIKPDGTEITTKKTGDGTISLGSIEKKVNKNGSIEKINRNSLGIATQKTIETETTNLQGNKVITREIKSGNGLISLQTSILIYSKDENNNGKENEIIKDPYGIILKSIERIKRVEGTVQIEEITTTYPDGQIKKEEIQHKSDGSKVILKKDKNNQLLHSIESKEIVINNKIHTQEIDRDKNGTILTITTKRVDSDGTQHKIIKSLLTGATQTSEIKINSEGIQTETQHQTDQNGVTIESKINIHFQGKITLRKDPKTGSMTIQPDTSDKTICKSEITVFKSTQDITIIELLKKLHYIQNDHLAIDQLIYIPSIAQLFSRIDSPLLGLDENKKAILKEKTTNSIDAIHSIMNHVITNRTGRIEYNPITKKYKLTQGPLCVDTIEGSITISGGILKSIGKSITTTDELSIDKGIIMTGLILGKTLKIIPSTIESTFIIDGTKVQKTDKSSATKAKSSGSVN